MFETFYTNYIHKLIRNDDSLVLLFHISSKMFVKYNLLDIFKSFLKILQLDKILNETKTKKIDTFAIQVN